MKKIFLFITIIILSLSCFACTIPTYNGENDGDNPGGNNISSDLDNVLAQEKAKIIEDCKYIVRRSERESLIYPGKIERPSWVSLLYKRFEEKIMLAETEEEVSRLSTQFTQLDISIGRLFRTDSEFRNGIMKEKAFSGEVDGISFEMSSWPMHPTNNSGLKLRAFASDEELEFRMYAKGCTFWNGTDYDVVKPGNRAEVDTLSHEVEDGAYLVAIIAKGKKIYGFAVIDYFKDATCSNEDKNKRFYAYTFEESAWLTVTEQQILANVAGEEDNLPDMERCKVGEKNWSGDVTLIFRSKGKNSDAPEIEFADKYVSSFNFEGVEYEVFSETPFTYAGQKVNSAILQPNESIVWSDQSGKNGGLGVIVRREGKIVGVCVIIVPQKSGLGIEASFISVCYKFEIDKDIYYFPEYLALGYDPDEDFARAVIDGYIKEYVE